MMEPLRGVMGSAAHAATTDRAAHAATRLRIDTAKVGVDGLLRVDGWAAGPVPVDLVQIFLGHAFIGLAELGVARADIGLAFPHDPRAAWSGFRFVTDVSHDDLSERIIHARVVLADGMVLRETAMPEAAALSHAPSRPPSGIEIGCEQCARTQDGGWTVSGWAFALAGIAEIALALDDGAPIRAAAGLSRPDIGNRFPRIPGARHAGFAFRGTLPQATASPRALCITAKAADGQERRLLHGLLADPARPETPAPRGISRDLANRIKFFVDSPELVEGVATQAAGSALLLRGWAIARDGIASVEVQCDGITLGQAHRGLHRPDIGAAFPTWPEAHRSGFALGIAPKLLHRGNHTIRVVARDSAGGSAETAFGVSIPADAEPLATTLPRPRVRQAEIDLNAAILRSLGAAPRFTILLQLARTSDAELTRARASLRAIREQAYENWQVVILLPEGVSAGPADALADELGELRGRVKQGQGRCPWTPLGPEAPDPRFWKARRGHPTYHASATPACPLLAFQKLPVQGGSPWWGSGGKAPGLLSPDHPGTTHVLVLRAGDLLGCDALMEFAVEASLPPLPDFVYADERRHDPAEDATAPDFRPQWSPDLLLSTNYIGRSWCARIELVAACGITEAELYRHGTYDLVLRLTEQARVIRHVPKLLCETARGGDSAARERRALERTLRRRGIAGRVEPGLAPYVHRVRRAIGPDAMVSIIMPTCGSRGLFRTAIAALRARTEHAPFELIAIDTIPAARREDKAWLRAHADRVIPMAGKFNWSKFNNEGARAARGRFLLFLNDDVEISDPGWLGALVEQAQRPEIGAVGARLLYPDGTLQHAGISLSPTRGLHGFRFMPRSYPGPFGRVLSLRDVSAVTGACLMVRKEVFERFGGFDEAHAIINNDLDFCLRLREAGLAIVCTPHAELIHHELASRAALGEAHDAAKFRAVCGPALARGDPYLNPNLSRFSERMLPEPEPTRVTVAGHPLLAAGRVRRILALKLDHIGDFITAFAAFRRLKQRFPEATLDVLCSPASAKLARLEPAIDTVIEFAAFHETSSRGPLPITPRARDALGRTLGQAGYDIAIDLRKHPETRALLRATGARILAGFDRDRAFPWLDIGLEWDGDPPLIAKRGHITDDLLALVEAVAIACQSERAREIEAAPRLPGRARIGVHPAAGSILKQWPAEHFATLMDLLADSGDVEFIMIGAAQDRAVVSRVIEHMRHADHVRSLAGAVDLRDLPEVLRHCDLFIGNDSGPKHLAASLGVPTIGIHSGVVDPAEWSGIGPASVAVHRQMACSPCYLTDAKACKRDLACLRGLPPADVAAVCRRMVGVRGLGGAECLV